MRRRRRERGSGSVFHSAVDQRWIAKFPLGVVNGRRQEKRVKCRTRDEADAELERLRRAYGRGANPATGTLDQYLGDWLRHHSRSIRASTATSYRIHIERWISPLLGGIPLAKLRPSDVRRLIDELERKGKSAGYIHLVIRTLSVALNAAVSDRSITDNATRGVRLPRIDREPVRALTDDEADAILEAVAGHWVEWPVRVWLGSGLRRGEVLGLDQRDLALDRGFVQVRVTKTRVRAVPISDDAVSALRSALAGAPRRGPAEPVFFSPRSKERMRGDSITHALPRILEAAGLGHLTVHSLRHAVASLMVAKGVHIRTVAEQLGHASPSLTLRTYAHIAPQQQIHAIRLIERRRAK